MANLLTGTMQLLSGYLLGSYMYLLLLIHARAPGAHLEKAAYSMVWFQGLHGGVRLPAFSGQFYARKIHPGKIQQTIMDVVPISYT